MKPQRLVSINQISVRQGRNWVLSDVSLTIDRGKIVTLIGPNGAGKTTLAKVVMGSQRISRGSVWRQKNLRFGYVPQQLTISQTMPMTVERLLFLSPVKEQSGSGKEKRQEDQDTIRYLEIDHLLTKQVHDLSGGQFRSVMLARAMLRKPSLLVMDEPLQGVDVQGETAFYRLLDRMRSHINCGILMISHDLHVVMSKTDWVLCLDTSICCQGRPQDVKTSPHFAKLFNPNQAESALSIYHHSRGLKHDRPTPPTL